VRSVLSTLPGTMSLRSPISGRRICRQREHSVPQCKPGDWRRTDAGGPGDGFQSSGWNTVGVRHSKRTGHHPRAGPDAIKRRGLDTQMSLY
jgi:hypothetical protein